MTTGNDALQTQNNTMMERPARLKAGDRRGTENITREDANFPSLRLAQQMSPQVTEGDPKYIEGLKPGMLFNSLTGEIYGKGPIEVAVIRQDPPRGVQFAPIEEGGGIIDPNVPLDDPRMKFHGKEKPVATKFMDFVIMFVDTKKPIALSLKGGMLKTAKDLNGYIIWRDAPIFEGRYKISVDQKMVPKPHYIYVIKNAGWLNDEESKYAEELFESFKDKKLDIDRDSHTDDDLDFPPVSSAPSMV